MSWNPLSKSKRCPIELSFQYHKTETNNLVLYNVGSKKIRDLTVLILCKSGDKYITSLKEISVKTGELIKISEIENCLITSADISKVEVSTNQFNYTFIPDKNTFRIK